MLPVKQICDCRSRRDCGNLEAVGNARFRGKTVAAVAATAAILRRSSNAADAAPLAGRSRRDCGDLEAACGLDGSSFGFRPQSPRLRQS